MEVDRWRKTYKKVLGWLCEVKSNLPTTSPPSQLKGWWDPGFGFGQFIKESTGLIWTGNPNTLRSRSIHLQTYSMSSHLLVHSRTQVNNLSKIRGKRLLKHYLSRVWKSPETAVQDSQPCASSHTLSIIPAKLLKRTESFCPFHPSAHPLMDQSGTHDIVSNWLMKMHNLHGNAVYHSLCVPPKLNKPKRFRGVGRAVNKHQEKWCSASQKCSPKSI